MPVYRLMLKRTDPYPAVDTGATYPGCSKDNPDACNPIQFATIQDATDYAKAHGEIPYECYSEFQVWSIVEEQANLNKAPVISVAPAAPPASSLPPSSSAQINVPTGYNTSGPSSLTVPADSGNLLMPKGAPPVVYRMILETAPGRVDTGATYPACQQNNPTACDPKQFSSVSEAVAYAIAHAETPLKVANATEAWDIAEGRTAPNPANIISAPGGAGGDIMSQISANLPLLAGAGLVLYLLVGRGKRS